MGRQVWLGARIIMIVTLAFLVSLTLPGGAAAEFGDEKFKPGDAAVDFTAVPWAPWPQLTKLNTAIHSPHLCLASHSRHITI